MLIYSMSVSVDGFIADREGAFDWGVPSDELHRDRDPLIGCVGWFAAFPAGANCPSDCAPTL